MLERPETTRTKKLQTDYISNLIEEKKIFHFQEQFCLNVICSHRQQCICIFFIRYATNWMQQLIPRYNRPVMNTLQCNGHFSTVKFSFEKNIEETIILCILNYKADRELMKIVEIFSINKRYLR